MKKETKEEFKKRVIKDVLMIAAGVVMLIAFIIIGIKEEPQPTNINVKTDAEKFAAEYTSVPKNNPFVYKTGEDIVDILEGGTGVVYLGFPECKWCQAYVIYLNEVATEVGLKKIYYFNIREDRENNTEIYKEILDIIGKNLQKDEEGKPRVYVPDVSFIQAGKMIGHDYETSLDTGGFKEPIEYWTEDKATALKTKLKNYMTEIASSTCETCD